MFKLAFLLSDSGEATIDTLVDIGIGTGTDRMITILTVWSKPVFRIDLSNGMLTSERPNIAQTGLADIFQPAKLCEFISHLHLAACAITKKLSKPQKVTLHHLSSHRKTTNARFSQ